MNDSYFLLAYNLKIPYDGVKTDNIPGIFYLIPVLVKYTAMVETTLAYIVLSLNGKTASENLTYYPDLALLIRSYAITLAKLLPDYFYEPSDLIIESNNTSWNWLIDLLDPSVKRFLTASKWLFVPISVAFFKAS